MRRIGSDRMVSVSFCVANNRFPVNNESGCQGQCPRIVSIVFGKIKAELQIDFTQIFRQCMHQPELLSHRIPRVT